MQSYFYSVSDRLFKQVPADHELLVNFSGEESDFIRFNHARVRQAGSVEHHHVGLKLIHGRRHASAHCDVSGDVDDDARHLQAQLRQLHDHLQHLPPDPYLSYATDVHSGAHVLEQPGPPRHEVIDTIVSAAGDADLVGIWASGRMHFGFANSLGQRNWHSVSNFNFDWSCHTTGDKAVKGQHAGSRWSTQSLHDAIAQSRVQLTLMGQPARTLAPGRYRAYLAPTAVAELLDTLAQGGFGLKSHRTAQSPLLKMTREGVQLDPRVHLQENHRMGFSPLFTPEGFIKPARITVIEQGTYAQSLTDARSATEYDSPVNAAGEYPESLDMEGGHLAANRIVDELDTGLYINNLWYCNFSDRNNGRITGMTRFGCFWVENGRVQAPINVMRFDDTIYRILGDGLADLTRERQLIADPCTYERRSTAVQHLPGILIDDFQLTL